MYTSFITRDKLALTEMRHPYPILLNVYFLLSPDNILLSNDSKMLSGGYNGYN